MERGEGVRSVVESAAMPAVDVHVQAMQAAAARQRQGVQQVEVASPWTRMKWTDAMVTLLISVVYSMGDDGEGGVGGKGGKGSAAAQAAAAAQKKGKWKTVSRAMMEKGFRVSPQQCEDKFNDLNKRYKRVVDLLGRGMACRVVENNALLDTVEGLTSKAREEARKLLSSKHLFFREMCAYHNATAVAASHMATGSGGAEAACFHHPPPTPPVAPAPVRQVHPSLAVKHSPGGGSPGVDAATGNDADDDSDSYNVVSNDYDEDLEDEENEATEIKNCGGHHHSGRRKRGASEDAEEHGAEAKMPRTLQQLRSELAATAGGARDARQLLQWVRLRRLELEEQRMEYEAQAYQLESQRLKWLRFTAAKERQMDSLRLRNDDLLLDTRRMILMLRHKEVEFDAANTNANPGNSSSADHHPTPPPPPQQQHDSSPSTTGHHR